MILFKKPLILSILSGILLTLSWPIYQMTPLIFFGLIPIFFLENKLFKLKRIKDRIKIWFFIFLSFLIWNIGTTWWILNASIFGMLFAIFCNSSFYTFIIFLFNWAKKRLPIRTSYIFLITLWISFEKFHLEWDFSWPWLNLGNVFSERISWIQWYEFTGSFGGTLWVLLINIGIFEKFKNSPVSLYNLSWLSKLAPYLFAILLPIIISISILKKENSKNNNTEVLILQPNIDPYNEKYENNNIYYFNLMAELFRDQITDKTNYLFTPETYFGYGIGEPLNKFRNTRLFAKLDSLTNKYPKIQLISGIQFYNIYKSKLKPTPTANKIDKKTWVDFYNSALKLENGSDPEFYHKSKLVVGVENMPYKSFFQPIIGNFLIDLGGTISSRAIQKNRSVFEHQTIKLKVGPIICYESVYGEFVTEYTRKGASFFAIITNDAWWGKTPGHKQLLSYSRLRAIENRRDIVRSANTGISAIINKNGEIIKKIPYGIRGVLKGNINPSDKITFYTKYGDFIARWSGFIFVLTLLIAISGRLKTTTK